jgi:hypothetical protein
MLTEDILAKAVEDWGHPCDVISVCLRSNLKNAEDSRDLPTVGCEVSDGHLQQPG